MLINKVVMREAFGPSTRTATPTRVMIDKVVGSTDDEKWDDDQRTGLG